MKKGLFLLWLIALLNGMAVVEGPDNVYQYVILIMNMVIWISVTLHVTKHGGNDEK